MGRPVNPVLRCHSATRIMTRAAAQSTDPRKLQVCCKTTLLANVHVTGQGWAFGSSPIVMIKLITNAGEIYCPERTDCKNLLIAGTSIAALLTDTEAQDYAKLLPTADVHDAAGCSIVPGFIDMHVHMTGGGGEAGPASRCPEAQLSDFLDAGITTAVGVLGTDTVTRSQENLVAKCKALNASGMTCYHWCGGYAVPPPTATGSIQRDMVLIDSCLGVGEVAVSDHRSSVPSIHHLANIASQARVGGMLSGKCGLVYCHMGVAKEGLQPLTDAVSCSDVPITQFLPTHVERTPELISEGGKWIEAGGYVNLTCRTHEAIDALQRYMIYHLPLNRCTVASDGFGSWPVYDKQGKLLSYEVADLGAMMRFMLAMKEEGYSLPFVLQFMTSNVATVLQLQHKGQIAAGKDADLLCLHPKSLKLQYVYANGTLVRTPAWTRGGMFERGKHIRPIHPVMLM